MRLALCVALCGCFSKPAPPPTAQCRNLGPWTGGVQTYWFENLNRTDSDEWGAYLSPDHLELVFSSDHGGMNRLYHAVRADPEAQFPAATELVVDVPLADDPDPFLSDDGKRMWFSALSGDPDLFVAERADRASPFGPSHKLGNINTAMVEADPELTPDELTMYFTVGLGVANDIYVTHRAAPNLEFSDQKPVAGLMRPDADESSPTLSADGGTMIVGIDHKLYTVPIDDAVAGTPVVIDEVSANGDAVGDPMLTRDGTTLVFNQQVATGTRDLAYIVRPCND